MGRQKLYKYQRVCLRCKKFYKTDHKYSKYCTNCHIKPYLSNGKTLFMVKMAYDELQNDIESMF